MNIAKYDVAFVLKESKRQATKTAKRNKINGIYVNYRSAYHRNGERANVYAKK